MPLACLTALLHREVFIDGATEVIPFIQNLGQNFEYTKMSYSQERYMNYFSQILLHDLTPLSKPLILSKILIVIDEPSIEAPEQPDSEDSEGEIKNSSTKQVLTEVMDYSMIAENLFFRVYEGTVEEDTLIFDQLD